MNLHIKRALALLLLAVTAIPSIQAQNAWSVTGKEKTEFKSLDSFMTYFMKTYDLRGGQLAVARNGKVLYARGYSWAPAGVPKIQPDNLFRIASLSKVITGIMIHKLIEKGQLSINTKVQDVLKLANNSTNGRPLPVSTRPVGDTTDGYYFWAVTIRDLLTHRGGWDRDINSANDPTFHHDNEIAAYYKHSLPVNEKEIAMWGASRPMQNFPGKEYHYSNFGYLLLGLVIEKLTGKDYVTAVRDELMIPSMVLRPTLSATLQKDKTAKETTYTVIPAYSKECVTGPGNCPIQYGGENNGNFDAFGGWAMSAVDYVKLLADYRRHVEGMPLVSRDQLLTWSPRKTGGTTVGYEHGGSLPGTWSYTIARNDGIDFMVVWNTTNGSPAGFTWNGTYYGTGGHETVWNKILDDMTNWPTDDLTDDYFKLNIQGIKTPKLPQQKLLP